MRTRHRDVSIERRSRPRNEGKGKAKLTIQAPSCSIHDPGIFFPSPPPPLTNHSLYSAFVTPLHSISNAPTSTAFPSECSLSQPNSCELSHDPFGAEERSSDSRS
jgi:hypothetical protein